MGQFMLLCYLDGDQIIDEVIKNMIETQIKTPCIGICSTALGDDVCRGCKRYGHEIISWNGYNEVQKKMIDGRLEGFLGQIVANKFNIFDLERLQWQLQLQPVKLSLHRNIHCQFFELLKAGASQMEDKLEEFGVSRRSETEGLSLREVYEAIDHEFLLLSQAHYQRYMIANQRLVAGASPT